MVVASRPFDMMPEELRSICGQLFEGRCLCGLQSGGAGSQAAKSG
jgi:hypothetical protein